MIGAIVYAEIIGYHNYPGAPDDVSFLRDSHRHVFVFRIHMAEEDANRGGVEIFEAARNVKAAVKCLFPRMFDTDEFDFGTRSCEQIAQAVGLYLENNHHYQIISFEVMEDGQGGGYFSKEGVCTK